MQTETQFAGDGGGGVVVAIGAADDYPDDVRAIGDKVASLTPQQAAELNAYLKEVYGVEPT